MKNAAHGRIGSLGLALQLAFAVLVWGPAAEPNAGARPGSRLDEARPPIPKVAERSRLASGQAQAPIFSEEYPHDVKEMCAAQPPFTPTAFVAGCQFIVDVLENAPYGSIDPLRDTARAPPAPSQV